MYICIDPGVDCLGISVMDNSGKKIRLVETVPVLNKRRFTDEEKEVEKEHGPRTVKIFATIKILSDIIDKYNPSEIVIEAPFYSALTPVAYSSLLEVISAIKYSLTIPKGVPVVMIEPTVIKKIFTGNGMASKDLMKEILIDVVHKQKLMDVPKDFNVEELTEHQIDATAIGFIYPIYEEHKDVFVKKKKRRRKG